jgi:hypothetical protein
MNSGDSIVDAVVQKFLQRSAVGQAKYGVTLDRTDLTTRDWVQHTQEELMDAILYLERLKQDLKHLEVLKVQDVLSNSNVIREGNNG